MAFKAGKNAYLTVNALKMTNDLASEITFPMGSDEMDASTIGGNWKAFLQGQTEATMSVTGVWDDGTAATNLDAVCFALLTGGTKLYEYMPGGSPVGTVAYQPLYKGNCFATGYEIGAPVAGRVGFSLSLRNSGTITRSIAVGT